MPMACRTAMLLAIIVCCETVAPESVAAQARAIPMPDTLGANFAVADSARGTASPDDLDFLIGMWHFRFQQRNVDGTFGAPFNGHWFFERARTAGALVVDHWRSDNPATTLDAGTWTYRTFNPRRNLWEMQGVDVTRGAWQPGLIWSDSSGLYVIQHNGTIIMRFRYFNIEADRFLWRADRSADGGRTWLLDRWTMEVTRVAR